MKRLFSNFDWGIVSALVVLGVLGLTIIKSVAPDSFVSQLIYFLLGLLIFFLFSQIDFRVYPRLGGLIYLASLLGLILTFIFGAITRGAIRWIQLGGFTFQPSELVKPFLILSFGSLMISQPVNNWRAFLTNLFLLALPVLLIFWQPDLGSSLVVIFFWLVMVLASGMAKRFLVLTGVLAALAIPVGWFLLRAYQQLRITSFLNPFADPLGSGYNIIQSMIAVGSGQIWGRGLGRGPQSHLRFLPERHTDFVFASLAEELGFLGSAFLILVGGFLLWRIIKVAFQSREKVGSLICLGVFGMLFIQIFINIGMNLGLVPVTGITLPLVSYGGSSLVATLISLGIVENVARYGKKGNSLV